MLSIEFYDEKRALSSKCLSAFAKHTRDVFTRGNALTFSGRVKYVFIRRRRDVGSVTKFARFSRARPLSRAISSVRLSKSRRVLAVRLALFKTNLRGTERRRLVFESRGGRGTQSKSPDRREVIPKIRVAGSRSPPRVTALPPFFLSRIPPGG